MGRAEGFDSVGRREARMPTVAGRGGSGEVRDEREVLPGILTRAGGLDLNRVDADGGAGGRGGGGGGVGRRIRIIFCCNLAWLCFCAVEAEAHRWDRRLAVSELSFVGFLWVLCLRFVCFRIFFSFFFPLFSFSSSSSIPDGSSESNRVIGDGAAGASFLTISPSQLPVLRTPASSFLVGLLRPLTWKYFFLRRVGSRNAFLRTCGRIRLRCNLCFREILLNSNLGRSDFNL